MLGDEAFGDNFVFHSYFSFYKPNWIVWLVYVLHRPLEQGRKKTKILCGDDEADDVTVKAREVRLENCGNFEFRMALSESTKYSFSIWLAIILHIQFGSRRGVRTL